MDPALDDRTEADKLLELATQLVETMLIKDKMPIYEEMARLINVAQTRDAAWLAECERQREARRRN